MQNLIIVDTNVLMDSLMHQTCKEERKDYELIIDILKGNLISTSKLCEDINEEITDKDLKNIEEAIKIRREKCFYITESLNKIILTLGKPELAVTYDITEELKRNLSGIEKIDKKKIAANNSKRDEYISKVVSRLVYSRYKNEYESCLSSYTVLSKTNKFLLPYSLHGKDSYIFSDCLYYNAKGIITSNKDDYIDINKEFIPPLAKGIDIFVPSDYSIRFNKIKWQDCLRKNESISPAEYVINLFKD